MASVLLTGEVQFSDGRILYNDSVINGKDYIELALLLPKLVPVLGRAGLVGFPFGGGGAGQPGSPGPAGTVGPAGPAGAPGAATPKAATFVVDPTVGVGDYTTIEAAVAATPVEGADIYLREGTYAPVTTIVLPGDRDVKIRGAGAVGIAKITAPTDVPLFSVAALSTGDYHFVGFEVVGDNSFSQVFLTLDAVVYVTMDDVEVTGVRTIIETSTTPYVSALYCKFALTSGSGTASFWRGSATGGTLTWDNVQASISTPSTAGITGVPDWVVTASYIGGGATKTTCNVGKATFQGFRLDKIKLHIASPGSTLVNVEGIDSRIAIENARTSITGSTFSTPTLVDNQIIAIPGLGAGGVVDIAITGCTFNGNNVVFSAIDVSDVAGVVIGACSFSNCGVGNLTDAAILVGATGGTTQVTVVGCEFSGSLSGAQTSIAVYEFFALGTIVGRYTDNIGFETSNIAADSFSTVNGIALVQRGTSTTDAFVSLFTQTNVTALDGYGLIKNTGAQTLDIRETITDAFGVTTSATNAVVAAAERILNLRANINTGRPPYLSYQVEVKSTGAGLPTTFTLRHMGLGVQTWI